MISEAGPTSGIETGERIVPWGDKGLFAWHHARYEFALPFVRDRRVLDIGAGEGYGAALLASAAREVVGIDYSSAAMQHARATYQLGNLRFETADATQLESEYGQFEVVTCFEVIEHVRESKSLLARLSNMMTSDGWLILSTPNGLVDHLFDAIRHDHNDFHINVLTPRKLRAAMTKYFTDVRIYGQSLRGRRLYHVIKAMDLFNLRHRLIRSLRIQRAIAKPLVGSGPTPSKFVFSNLLVRQSPILVATGRWPAARKLSPRSR